MSGRIRFNTAPVPPDSDEDDMPAISKEQNPRQHTELFNPTTRSSKQSTQADNKASAGERGKGKIAVTAKRSPKRQEEPTAVPSGEPYAELYSIRLYETDLRSLDDSEWYTCTILHIWSRYLIQRVINPALGHATEDHAATAFSNSTNPSHPRLRRLPRIVILAPSQVQLLKDSESGAAGAIDTNEMGSVDYVFAPLNQYTQIADGGVHWALVLVAIKRKRVYLFDAQKSLLLEEARLFSERFRDLLERRILHGDDDEEDGGDAVGGRDQDNEGGYEKLRKQKAKKSTHEWQIRCIGPDKTPQDPTGRNCGPIVCWIMKVIVTRMCEAELDWGMSWTSKPLSRHDSSAGVIMVPRESDYWNLVKAMQRFDASKERERQRGWFHIEADWGTVLTV